MLTKPNSNAVSIDGWNINIPDQFSALEAILGAARNRMGFTLFTLNLDHLVKLRTNDAFRKAYKYATFVTADGEPVARLARKQDPKYIRTTGADLVLPLALACADAKLPIFLFGSSPAVLSVSARRLLRNTSGILEIAGTLSPKQAFDPQGPAADEAINRIISSGARICFVALGAPKQEIFAARAIASGAKVGFVCIGAALDFLAGQQSRAPAWCQSAGLEWLWRLTTNPQRLAVRYAKCAMLLGRLTIIEPFFSGNSKRRTP